MTTRLAFSAFCKHALGKGALAVCIAVCTLGVGLSASHHKPTIITFDVPGAATLAFLGTTPDSINPAGAITGSYTDASFVAHGFLRAPDGTITSFDPPGSIGTLAFSINPAGAITGYYTDANRVDHGFLRAPDGSITTFDAPGSMFTFSFSINPAGAITGYYTDASFVDHGFLRAADGTITTFDAPGAGTGPSGGTNALSINPAGAITGYYIDANQVNHGFLRAPDGTITTFDAPGAGTGINTGQGTIASSINPAGAITGYYIDANQVNHGFLRAPDGTITSFDPPGSITTMASSINPAGAITGCYTDSNFQDHAFLRAKDGTFTKFDAPGAATQARVFLGTVPQAINPAGTITGYYTDAFDVLHGFVRIPASTDRSDE